MTRTLRILLAFVTVLMFHSMASACYQVWPSYSETAIEGATGRALYNGQPLRTARLTLEEASDSWWRGHPWLKDVLKMTATDRDGNFDFGDVPDGLYVIESGAPVGESVVRVMRDSHKIFWARVKWATIDLGHWGQGCMVQKVLTLPGLTELQ